MYDAHQLFHSDGFGVNGRRLRIPVCGHASRVTCEWGAEILGIHKITPFEGMPLQTDAMGFEL